MQIIGTPGIRARTDTHQAQSALYTYPDSPLPTYLPTCSLTSLPAGLLAFGEAASREGEGGGDRASSGAWPWCPSLLVRQLRPAVRGAYVFLYKWLNKFPARERGASFPERDTRRRVSGGEKGPSENVWSTRGHPNSERGRRLKFVSGERNEPRASRRTERCSLKST